MEFTVDNPENRALLREHISKSGLSDTLQAEIVDLAIKAADSSLQAYFRVLSLGTNTASQLAISVLASGMLVQIFKEIKSRTIEVIDGAKEKTNG